MAEKKILVSLNSSKFFDVKKYLDETTGINHSNSDVVNFLVHRFLLEKEDLKR